MQADERPRNGWAGLGQTLGDTLDNSCLPLSAAPHASAASPPMPVPGSHDLQHSTPSLSSKRPMDPFETLAPLYTPALQSLAGTTSLVLVRQLVKHDLWIARFKIEF